MVFGIGFSYMEDKTMAKSQMPHGGHMKHLCYLVNMEQHKKDAKAYKALVKDAQYMCQGCGRVAAKAANLCAPVKL